MLCLLSKQGLVLDETKAVPETVEVFADEFKPCSAVVVYWAEDKLDDDIDEKLNATSDDDGDNICEVICSTG
jgi:hypothetical protein